MMKEDETRIGVNLVLTRLFIRPTDREAHPLGGFPSNGYYFSCSSNTSDKNGGEGRILHGHFLLSLQFICKYTKINQI